RGEGPGEGLRNAMPEPSTAARRYAEAIFDLGQESGTLDQWQRDLDTLANVAGDGGALGVLENVRSPMEDRLALLDRALTGMSPLAQNLAKLLVSRGRFSLTPRIDRVFGEMLDERNGVVRAEAITAVPLSDDEERAIVDHLRTITGARDVRLQREIDPSIIGGLIVRVGDQLIDGSTRSRLIQLRRRLSGVAP
ncbi:MAG: F0F1 ATP synthase subunit delta, partial [Dehalococcoidia bacterium]